MVETFNAQDIANQLALGSREAEVRIIRPTITAWLHICSLGRARLATCEPFATMLKRLQTLRRTSTTDGIYHSHPLYYGLRKTSNFKRPYLSEYYELEAQIEI